MHKDVSRLPRLLFGFKSGMPFDPSPWHFAEALRDPVAFHLMLSGSAHHVSFLEGHHPSKLAVLHKLKGLSWSISAFQTLLWRHVMEIYWPLGS